MFVRADIYDWHITDERAVCAAFIGKQAETFTLCRRLLARPDIPEDDRQRIAGNRDVCAQAMIDAASTYPDTVLMQSPQRPVVGQRGAEVVVSLIAGPDLATRMATYL